MAAGAERHVAARAQGGVGGAAELGWSSCHGLVVSAVQILVLPPSVDPIGMGSEGWHPSMEFILPAKLVEL